ncbi:hypothetical protein BOTBODRAFT_168516 [Botryobasidium botryosum FD-172 SS1]|uniref:RGS domain-containing protein n=1 Tax=Botryobasidium botryosum (strain FD-172 SS1) TaxID=930990 RepID=A0A067MZZ4_BOTB1|nr:hypothetical protein BOTBODRAFT_168516 [Botryobasidium botryosum FD-172 SS1]
MALVSTRPPSFKHSVFLLLDLPRRLCNPPPAVGKVRSCRLTPIFQVSLEDVLQGKHLPPLSLKDFEEYLLFQERSVENLYFTIWLKEYAEKYEAEFGAPTNDDFIGDVPVLRVDDASIDLATLSIDTKVNPSPSSIQLMHSFRRAKQTFFVPGAPLELNLNSNITRDLLDNTERSCPSPEMLIPVKEEVDKMLRGSLDRFVLARYSNNGPQRTFCGLLAGVGAILLGFAPVLMSILGGEPRGVRWASLPCFWLGWLTTVASTHGVCLSIYLFGDARQMHPFELVRPKISQPLTRKDADIELGQSSPLPDRPVSAYSGGASSSQVEMLRPDSRNSYDADSEFSHATTASFIPSYYSSSATDVSIETSYHGIKGPVLTIIAPFDFDALPSYPSLPSTPADSCECRKFKFPSIPAFGPLTRVLNPIIQRAQWEIAIRSALLSTIITIVSLLICVLVPARPLR